MGQGVSEMFPPKPKFGVQDIPDLSGKVVIVTGTPYILFRIKESPC